MTLFTTIQQAYHLASPYFSPQRDNWLRIGTLAGSILMMTFRAKFDQTGHKQIYAVYDFFKEKKPLEEFSKVFQSAVGGYVTIIATNIATDYLSKHLSISFRSAMLRDTLKRWLKSDNYRGVKALDHRISEKFPSILVGDIHNFTSISLTLLIRRIGDLAINLLSLYRIYQLSKPLHSKSLQFPLNHPGGVFALMIGILGLFSWIKIHTQAKLKKTFSELDKKQFGALRRTANLERNALQTASLPQPNRHQITTSILTQAEEALTASSSFSISSFFNTNFTFMFPNAFELAVVYLASLFAKADPENFDYIKSFQPLFRESITFMWRSTNFIQGMLGDWLHYQQSIQEIEALYKAIDGHEKQVASLPIRKGSEFCIQDLSVTVQTDQGPKTLFSQLDLKLDPGFIYFIRGKNGSGKTTFLKTIAGFQPFTQGLITTPEQVWYLQPKIEIDPERQSFVEMVQQTFGIQAEEEVETVRSYLKQFKLYYTSEEWTIPAIKSGNRNWSTLSDGQKQILNLAVVCTLVNKSEKPWLILADEILGQVDNISDRGPSPRTIALNLLKSIAGSLHTILLVDHSGVDLKCTSENEVPLKGNLEFKLFRQS